MLAAVDVAGRDLGGDDVVVADRHRRAVVGDPVDAGELAGVAPVEHEHLAPAGRRVVGVGRRLAVHAHVARRLLDEPVRLGGDDEAVLGEPDVEGLARAAQGEQHAVGVVGGVGGDGDRALEGGDRRPERLDEVGALGEAAATRASG